MLINASVASMIYKFNMSNIEILENMGYKVDVSCNFGKENPISDKELCKFKDILKSKNIDIYENECPRNVFAFRKIVRTYKQLKNLIDSEEYDLIHTQSPIGGVICRFAARKARKKGTKVIYTAHGFHFYKGSPIKNWIFYPIEKIFSNFTDLLITINREDYERAQKFYSSAVEYIPGVGVDIERYMNVKKSKHEKRIELGINDDKIVFLSVGELSERKNHQIVIKALAKLKNPNFLYLIAGVGPDCKKYLNLAKQYAISQQLVLLGHRTDINELCIASDVFIHPSVREGLGIAPLEGMASGLPLISSFVNGIRDYTKDGVTGCCIENPLDVSEFEKAINKMLNVEFRKQCGKNNILISQNFSLDASKKAMAKIYEKIVNQ